MAPLLKHSQCGNSTIVINSDWNDSGTKSHLNSGSYIYSEYRTLNIDFMTTKRRRGRFPARDQPSKRRQRFALIISDDWRIEFTFNSLRWHSISWKHGRRIWMTGRKKIKISAASFSSLFSIGSNTNFSSLGGGSKTWSRDLEPSTARSRSLFSLQHKD